MRLRIFSVCAALLLQPLAQAPALAQSSPLRIQITEGVIEPMPIAVPLFVAENAGARQTAAEISDLVVRDLTGSGIFREVPRGSHVGSIEAFDDPVQFTDWKVVNAQALVAGAVRTLDGDRISVKFRLFDVFAGREISEGLRFVARRTDWRRIAHKVADAVYSRLTGETGYFDTRVVYVAEEGPKQSRRKRLAIMDYDGANHGFLTEAEGLVIAPRFSPDGNDIIYTSYRTGEPQVYILDLRTRSSRRLLEGEQGMSFAPRFSPDGRRIVMSLTSGGNTDIFAVELATGQKTRLTTNHAIETAPSYSPDGAQIVFESDRGGRQQLYVMPAAGGTPHRISRGRGKYGTPVWSPRGDYIAFTNINRGRFHIGVMRTDGTRERLLTESFLDEGPTWSPNGRVLMFFREEAGPDSLPSLFSVDITGRNLRRVPSPIAGSDPSWSPLRN